MNVSLSRRRLCAAVAMFFAAACAPSPTPSPSGQPVSPPTTAPPTTKPSAPPAAKSPADTAFDAKLKELTEAARKEGKVVLNAVPSPTLRQTVVPAFKQRFGVDLEVVSIDTNEAAQRAEREVAAGVVSMDLISGGQTTFAVTMYPKGLIEPIRPLLFHPDVKNRSVWLKGEPWFMDADGRILRVINAATETLHLNLDHVKHEDIKVAKDLLDPKWKGKVASYDPTIPGPGASNFAIMMRAVGEEFVVQLVRSQEVAFTRDRRQLADWLAQARHPIGIALNNQEVNRLRKDDFKVEDHGLEDVPATLSPTAGMFVLIKNAPHPSAAQLFLNWIISKEGMQLYVDSEGYPASRLDLDYSKLDPANMPKPGRQYFDTGEWEYTTKDRAKEFARLAELFRR